MSDYENYLQDLANQQQKTNLLATSLTDSLSTNPDEFARMKQLSKAASMDMAMVPHFKPELEQAAYLQQVNVGKLWEDAPVTARTLVDPDVAGLAHDDVENLSLIERAVKGLLPRPQSTLGLPEYQNEQPGTLANAGHAVRRFGGGILAGTVPDFNAAMWSWGEGKTRMLQEMTGIETIGSAADWMQRMRKTQEDIGNKLSGDGGKDGIVEAGTYSGARSFGNMAVGTVLSIMTGNPLPAMVMAGVTSGGQAVGRGLDKKLPAGQALMYGLEDATAEMVTGAIPMGRFLKDLKVGAPFWKMLGNNLLREAPTEAAATAWQSANEWMNLNPEQTLGDYVRGQGPAQVQTLVAVATTSLLTMGMGAGFRRLSGADRKAAQAERDAEMIGKMRELAKASKVLQRDPETFEALVKAAAEEGPATTVYIDGKTLLQSGLAEQVAQASPTVAAHLQEAAATGGQIAIPVEEYISRIAPQEYAQGLLDHVKFDPDGFTRAEAQEHIQNAGPAMKAEMERMVGVMEAPEAEAFRASTEAVKADVLRQLNEVGRFTPQVNEAYASLWGKYFATTGAELGVAPEQLYRDYALRVGAQSVVDARQFDQGSLTPTEEAGNAWRADLAKVGPSGVNFTARLGTPAVLKALGFKKPALDAPTRVLMQIATKHPDVPREVIERLPELVHDPLYAYPHKDGGWRVIVNATTAKGEPIAVGVDDGRLRTITPIHDTEGRTGQQAVQDAVVRVYTTHGAKMYARNVEALRSLGAEGFSTEAYRHNRVGPSVRGKASITGTKRLVNQFGEDYYQAARGSFSPDTWTINLFKNADLSSFLHESGHFFLEMRLDLASQIQAKVAASGIESLTAGERRILNDMNSLLAWFGLRDLAEWYNLDFEEKRPYHEQFARGFEAYLFEGKAPAIELHGLFQRFRAWLLNVYKELKALNVELTDEVRGVMDRMVATDEQIQLAEQGRSLLPLFASPEQAGMTEEEFSAYQAQAAVGSAEAVNELQARRLRDMQWLRNARSRALKALQKEAKAKRAEVEMEVRREVQTQPVYRAWRFLTGKLTQEDALPPVPGEIEGYGVDPEQVGAGRFDTGSLRQVTQAMGEAGAAAMHLLAARRMTSTTKGMHPDIVAELITEPETGDPAFDSGDALVRALVEANDMQAEIDALTDVRMLERYGDLATPEALERAADMAVHNEARMRMAATEANALARMSGQRKVLVEAAKEYAAAIIGRMQVRNVRPSQYANAAARAGKAADKAQRAGDLETAAAEKRNQLLQMQLARAAYEARQEADLIRRHLSKIANRSAKSLERSHDKDLYAAAQAIIGEYGIAERKGKTAAEYMKTVESYDPEMYAVVKGAIEAAQANAKPVNELSMDELRGLRDEIDGIVHLSKRSRQTEVDGNLMDRRGVADMLDARMQEIGIPLHTPGQTHAITEAEQRTAKLMEAKGFMRRVEHWVESMDGKAIMGPFRRLIWVRINDAANAYRADKAKYLKRYRELLDTIAPTLKPMRISAPELNYTFGMDAGGSGVQEIVHAILHTGNASNKRKLLLGRGWATETETGELDTRRWDAFIHRMAQEGRISKAHFDFAQSVWDMMESMKPAAQRTHRDVFGKYFDEVTAEEVRTPFGAYSGGYVPAIADTRIIKDAKMRALADAESENLAYAFPSTNRGFTKSRTEYNRPLLLDLRLLSQHIDKVVKFTHMEMPIRDVRRLLTDVGDTLERVSPASIDAMLVPWLNTSARQQVTSPVTADAGMSRFANAMRSRAGMAAMMGNLANAVQQVTGFALAALKVRPSLMLSATARYLSSPREMARTVAESSIFMNTRMENEAMAMAEHIEQIVLNPNLYEKSRDWTMRHAYFLQSSVDNVMGPIIWTAAYNQAVEAGQNHRDAVRLADSAVRTTQGSTNPEDLARFETGNAWWRLFTQFAGYFNMQANLLGTEFVKITRDMGLRDGAGRGLYVFAMGFMVPAVVGELIMQLFRGGPDDEDKDGEYLDDWIAVLAMAPIRTATAMLPFAGQGINALINTFNTKPYDDRMSSSPAISMLESAARAPVSVYKAVSADGSQQRAVRDVATLTSMALGLPGNLVARPLGYMVGVSEGRIDPVNEADAVRGVLTGSASGPSKN